MRAEGESRLMKGVPGISRRGPPRTLSATWQIIQIVVRNAIRVALERVHHALGADVLTDLGGRAHGLKRVTRLHGFVDVLDSHSDPITKPYVRNVATARVRGTALAIV
jgi:hypothetical protein